ncbi:13046_t:CDS:2, partial [Entrophospora sp. SA101]
MTKITTKEFPEFDKKLNELLERKPPGTSASKIKDLTKIALNTPKVLVMSKKVDDISSNTNTSQSSSPSWTGIEYLDRFEKLLEEMFTHIMQCPEHDKDKVERVLDLWYDKEVYNNEVIQRIKDIYFNQITLITQLVNSVNETKSVIVSSSNNDPKNMNPTTMDSSALLATLNNLTQGTLNIPSFLSSNPIISNTSMQPNAPWNSNSSQQPNVPFITPLGYNGPPTSVPPVSQPVYSLPPPAATNASATSNITGAAGPNPPQQQPGQLSPSGVPLIAGSIQPTSQISTFTPIAPVTQTVTYQSSPQQTPIPQDICLVYEDQSVGMKYIK